MERVGKRGRRREQEGEALKVDVTPAFLGLGDATLCNLEFSRGGDVWVSYGEEAISESDLLEIRQRHPKYVRVRTFPKQVEATNGLNWEWHGARRKSRT